MSKRILTAVLLAAVPLAAAAQTAPTTTQTATQTAAPALGRVFYSPAERKQLDARASGTPLANTDTPAASAPANDTLRYNGIARREGGAPMAWVNGTRTAAARLDGDALITPDQAQRLRPGQNSGTPEFAAPARVEVNRSNR